MAAKSEDAKNLGVLFTGYVEKKNPVTGGYTRRFLVLTQDAVHWFNRNEGYDLFGEERGHIGLGSIISIRVLDSDSNVFWIKSVDVKSRYFRCSSSSNCEEWVSALRSANKNFTTRMRVAKRQSVTGGSFRHQPGNQLLDDVDGEEEATVEVSVLLVSLKSSIENSEIVVARNPMWERIILLSGIKRGDQLVLSTSNGGYLTLSYEVMLDRAEDGVEFEVAVQGVALASSLKLKLVKGDVLTQSFTTSTSGQKKKNILEETLSLVFLLSTQDRRHPVTLMLSCMLGLVILNTLRSITADMLLLLFFACLITLQCISYVLFPNPNGSAFGILNAFTSCPGQGSPLRAMQGMNMSLVLLGHAFTSPDAPINEPEEIPKRFIDGCDGDLREARKRWDITRRWRETEGVNTILQEEQPHFFTIRAMYPHYHCGRGFSGNPVFYERPGEFECAQLHARGIRLEQLVRHWLFVTEYQWKILCKDDETAKSIAVIDIEKIKMGDLSGDVLDFLRKTISYANAHYPERSEVICIVNAPVWFSMLWKIIKPLVHENTQKKIKILSKKDTLGGLREQIPEDQIPIYYGGKLDLGGIDSCRHNSPDVLAMNEYVRNLNDKGGNLTSNKRPDDVPTSPPGKPGDDIASIEMEGHYASPTKSIQSATSPVPLSASSMDSKYPRDTNK